MCKLGSGWIGVQSSDALDASTAQLIFHSEFVTMFYKLVQLPILHIVGLISFFLFGIWLIVRIRTRYCDHEDPAAVEQQMLMQMGDLHRQGDLSEEEYRSIKGRLVERIDDSTRKQEQDLSRGDSHGIVSE